MNMRANGESGRPTRSRVSPSSGGSESSRFAWFTTGALLGRLHFLLNPKLLLAGIAVWALYEGVLSQHSVVNIWKFKQESGKLRQELADAEAKRDDLKRKIKLLESDEFTIEKLAREKLGFVKEGEILYRYEDSMQESAGEAPLTLPIVDEGEVPPPGGEAEERPPATPQ